MAVHGAIVVVKSCFSNSLTFLSSQFSAIVLYSVFIPDIMPMNQSSEHFIQYMSLEYQAMALNPIHALT